MSNASSSLAAVKPRKRSTPWNWFESVCVGLLAIIGADLVVGLIVALLGAVFKTNTDVAWLGSFLRSESITSTFVLYALSRLLGFGIITAFIHRRGVSLRQFGFKRFKFFRALGLIILASIALLVATIVVFLVVKQTLPTVDLEQTQDIVFTGAGTPAETLLAFLALVVIAPVVEESVFRGLMLPVFTARFGIIAATLITSTLFGIIHWQLNVGIVTGIMGLLLAWLYYKTRSLWPAIMFHSLKNLVAFLLLIHH